jgi:phage protein D
MIFALPEESMAITDLLNQLGASAPPAVRRPQFTVTLGDGAAADNGLGGLAGAIGSALGVNLGGGADPWQQHLLALRVESGLAPFADTAEMTLAVTPQSPPVALADSGSLSLGYSDDAAATVFTGVVAEIRHGLGMQQVRLTNGAAALARLRINQSFEQQSAGDIVSALAELAAVATETVEAGADYPFYVVSQGQSVYRHMAELARQNDFAAWLTPDDKLFFAPLTAGEPVATFTYGDNLLALQMNEAAPVFDAVTVIGEGAAGSQGAKAWSWLVKEPSAVTGDAGAGDSQRLVAAPGLRTGALAQHTAAGMVNRSSTMKVTGRLLATGAPAVTVGSTIEIVNAPQSLANGRFLVHRVRHELTRQQGFTTFISFAKAGEGGGGLANALSGLF